MPFNCNGCDDLALEKTITFTRFRSVIKKKSEKDDYHCLQSRLMSSSTSSSSSTGRSSGQVSCFGFVQISSSTMAQFIILWLLNWFNRNMLLFSSLDPRRDSTCSKIPRNSLILLELLFDNTWL